MPEAEDVVLEGAHRAAHALRAVWRRHVPAPPDDAVTLEDEARRLGDWLTACFGRSWPLAPEDAPPPPGWLARCFGSPAPWRLRPAAVPCHEDGRILLPRRLGPEAGDARARRALLLLATLNLGRRLERGADDAAPADAIARDCFCALEGALGDAWIASALPGLAPVLDEARRRARCARPSCRRLAGPAERRVEALVRRLLDGPAAELLSSLPAPLELGASPRQVADLARQLAAAFDTPHAPRYRGVGPVLHWGVGRRGTDPVDGVAAGDPPQLPRGRSRALARRLRARRPQADEADRRAGAFVLPFGDPALSVQDPAGLSRPTDLAGEDDLETLAEELEALGEAPRIRAPGAVREVLLGDVTESRAAAAPSAAVAPPGLRAFRYPEWDLHLDAYRPGHCRVLDGPAPRRETRPAECVAAERRRLHARLRRGFESLRPRLARRPRQRDGNELDLDGFVEELADRRAGLAPEGRVYSQERPRRRDVAVTLLLDVSGSTDAPVQGSRRVIDVEKEAALGFCEALSALGDRCAVLAFSGRGPEHVRVWRVKEFGESLGEGVRARLAGLEPEAFTRLGAALRHATSELARQRARARLLLVLSDGKPYDEDDYGGALGVSDVRQAVAEAERAGLAVFCVTVDREGPHYLPHLFGRGRYTVLWDVEQLPERLEEVYRRFTRGA